MEVAQAILAGLGFGGEHFRIVDAPAWRRCSAALAVGPASRSLPSRRAAPIRRCCRRSRAAPPPASRRPAATFSVQADKRATLDLALDHLMQTSPSRAEAIALPAPASPFGNLIVDTDACTLCLACVGACPEAALADNADRPQLRFIEKNCVQCGLCASTCPEDAITLEPRLLLADGGKARKQPRVLNEAEPFRCVRCGKPFGTLQAIEAMVAKLAAMRCSRAPPPSA